MADSLGFKLTLDSKIFEIKINNAERLLNRLSQRATSSSTGVKRLEGSFNSFGRTLSDTITTIDMASFAIGTMKSALFDWQKPILDSAGKLERLQIMLQGLATSSDKAAESMRDFNFIVDKAKNAPFSIESISDSFVKLKSAGIDPTKGSLDAMVDSVARFGGNSELLKRATIAIQQMSGKGVVSMEELRQQLGEAIPTAMQSMALGMNVSMAELVKAVSSGSVRSKDAIESMMNILEVSYGGSAKRMMNTYVGLLSQMQTNAALLAKSIGDSGYMDAVKDAIRDINRLLGSNAAVYYGKQFGEMVKGIIDASKEMLVWIFNNKEMLLSLGSALMYIAGGVLVLSFFKSITGALTGFNRMIATTVTSSGGLARQMLLISQRASSMGQNLNLGTIAIGKMKHAWRGLDAVMKANVIVFAVTTIIEVLALLAWWYDKVNEKAKNAMETAKNTPELVTDEQMEDLKKAKESQLKELKEIEKKIKYQQELMQPALEYKKSGKLDNEEALNQALKVEKALLKEKEKIAGKLQELQDSLTNTEVAKAKWAYERKLSQLEDSIEREDEVRKAALRSKLEALNAEMGAKLNAAKNDTALQLSIRKEYGEKMGVLYNEELERGKASITKQADLTRSEINRIMTELAKVRAQAGNNATDHQKKLITQLENQLLAATNSLNNYEKMYQSTLERIANSAKMFMGSIIGINGEAMDATSDALGGKLKTIEDNSRRNSASARLGNGEKIKTIDGRTATSQQELQTHYNIVDALKEEEINVDDLEVAYSNLSKSHKASIDAAMANARMAGDAANENKDNTSARAAESRAEKAKREAERMAEAHKKLLNDAEVMSEKISFGSEEVANYKKNLSDLRAELEKIANAVPREGILSQEQIDRANARLAEVKAEIKDKDYLNALGKDSADQLISKWAGFANTVKGSMTQSVTEMRSEFEKNYQEADKYFQKIIAAASNNEEVQRHLAEEHAKFQAGKLEAMVRMTETATAQMAYDYQNLGKLIDDNIKSVFDNLEDKLMSFLETGKFDIADFGNFIFNELQRTFIRSMVISPMINELGLGVGGNTGESFISKIGGAMGSIGSMFGGSGSSNATGGTDGIANPAQSFGENAASKSTEELGKAATETTGALQTMQSQGIFATLAGYAQQLWAMFTGATAQTANAAATTASSVANTTLSTSAAMASASLIQLSIAATTAAMKQSMGSFAFANGGIMSGSGAIPLKAYSKGGIATSPQLALFGEGSHNEAYVPLPDGRRIPVNMNINGDDIGAGAGSDKSVVISISVVNQGGDSNEKSNSSNESAWNETAQKIKSIVIETMTEEKRPGGMLTE
ncbi:tape measure protein [Xenorhabdus hominickii]|uniref:Lambda phage tail tape-measure protein n=1 Tax=Xenorhabdus hominickii TaxID=351679 RepID=A0A1V0M3W2_XENHO|nr:tape measure protein [Xenorhabdus hominickii]ARD69566.1 Lambda phage tail tape-measure protein [Xenorhabdus hominickii]PHM52396.1 hypothetical protein Xhom_04474 [Xenorhabdus hominickii]